jgi:OOP family OmpA-OmpF porin
MSYPNSLLGLTTVLVALVSAPLFAADSGPYIGGAGGQARLEADVSAIDAAFLQDDGFVATGTTFDNHDTAWKAFLGYRFNSFFALEGGYVDLGQATFDTTIVSAPAPYDALTPFPIHAVADAKGYNLVAIVGVPILPAVSVYAKGGAFRWKADYSEIIPSTGTVRVARSEEGTKPTFGAGVELRLNQWVRLRAEWERFLEVGSGIGGRTGANVDLGSVGLVLKF